MLWVPDSMQTDVKVILQGKVLFRVFEFEDEMVILKKKSMK
jgi:hypothetical protein